MRVTQDGEGSLPLESLTHLPSLARPLHASSTHCLVAATQRRDLRELMGPDGMKEAEFDAVVEVEFPDGDVGFMIGEHKTNTQGEGMSDQSTTKA